MASKELRAKLGLDGRNFQKGMARAKALAKGFGKAMIVAGAVAAGAFLRAVKATADSADEIGKMSKRIGFGTKSLQELRLAAKFAGADISDLEKAVKRMNVNILDFANGLSTPKDAFRDLGLELEDLKGKHPEEAFNKILESLSKIEDRGARGALADKVFGRGGGKLLPLINSGIEEYIQLRDRARKVGVFSDQDIKIAEDFNDKLEEVKATLKIGIGKELIKSMDDLEVSMGLIKTAAEDVAGGAGFGGIEDVVKEINTALKSMTEDGTFKTIGEFLSATIKALGQIKGLVQAIGAVGGQGITDMMVGAQKTGQGSTADRFMGGTQMLSGGAQVASAMNPAGLLTIIAKHILSLDEKAIPMKGAIG